MAALLRAFRVDQVAPAETWDDHEAIVPGLDEEQPAQCPMLRLVETKADSDSITVLTTKGGKLATKRITLSKVTGNVAIDDYDKAKHFSVTERQVSDIRSLAIVINEISLHPTSCIVRGRPTEGINRDRATRHLRPRTNPDGTIKPADLEDVARHWISLDLDGIPCPDHIDRIHDQDEVIEHAVSFLPEEFHGATCYWQFTSGHGIKPGIRVRLFFWSDRALEGWELKQWLGERIPGDGNPSDWPKRYPVDLALFTANQVTYTARPVFKDMHDPVPVRSGVWEGDCDEITPPVITRLEPAKYARGSGVSPAGGAGLGYEGNKARIGDGEGRDGFYNPIMSAIGAYFARHGSTADTEWLRSDLEQATRDRGHTRDAAYIDGRIADLDGAISSIQRQQAAGEELKSLAAQEAVCDPSFPDNGVSLEEGVHLSQKAVDRFMAKVRGWNNWVGEMIRPTREPTVVAFGRVLKAREPAPPVLGLIATLGIGKTGLLSSAAAIAPKQAYISVLVPNHALGKEVSERLDAAVKAAQEIDDAADEVVRAVGGERRVLRVYGRGMVVGGKPVCEESDLADKVQGAGKSVESHLCKRKRDDGSFEYCWDHPENPSGCGACVYQIQNADQEPAIRVAPVSYLAVPKDSSPLPEAGLTIIDEDPTEALIRAKGVFVRMTDIDDISHLTKLTQPEWRPGKGKEDDAAYEANIQAFKARSGALRSVLEQPNPTPAMLREARIDAKVCGEMIGLWHDQTEHLDITPSMDRSRKESGISAYRSQVALKLARLWELVSDVLDLDADEIKPIRVCEVQDKEGRPEMRIEMVYSIDPKIGGPTLICDGTANEEILRRFWPQIEISQIDVKAEHYHAIQVVNRAVGATTLGYNLDGKAEKPNPENELRSRNHRAKLARLAEVEAAKVDQPDGHGNKVFLSTYKLVADEIRKDHPRLAGLGVSTGVQREDGKWFGHLGAASGLNHWERTPTEIIAGRLVAAPAELERTARAIFYKDPRPMIYLPEGSSSLPKETRGIRMADGTGRAVEVECHPDPLVSCVLDKMMRGTLEQVLHRVRLIRRTAVNPARVIVATNVPLNLTIHETATYDDLMKTADLAGLLIARGVIPEDWAGVAAVLKDVLDGDTKPADAVRVWFDRNPEAAKRVEQAIEYRTFPLYNSLYGKCSVFATFKYRVAGNRKGSTVAVSSGHPDPRAAVEAWVGTLDRFELVNGKTQKPVQQPTTTETHVPTTLPATTAAEIINLPDAWVRLKALSARLDTVNPVASSINAAAALFARLEAVKPVALVTVDAVDDLSLRLAIANPAPVVVTLTDAVPGFESSRTKEPAPIVGNGGCSDVPVAEIVVVLPVYLGRLRADGIWVGPGEEWMDDELFPFRGAVQCRQRAYGPSGCPPHILAELVSRQAATPRHTPPPPPINNRMRATLQQGMSEWGLV